MVRVSLVPMLVMVTVASGIAPPLASVTMPAIDPYTVCPQLTRAPSMINATANKNCFAFLIGSPPSFSYVLPTITSEQKPDLLCSLFIQAAFVNPSTRNTCQVSIFLISQNAHASLLPHIRQDRL